MTVKVSAVVARAHLEPLLTVEDLEQMLRVDRRTIARLCKKGQLPPPLKLGGSNRWRVKDIEDALELLLAESNSAHKTAGALVAAV
jgi:predicted DNA-binding transcriptional regulator AlpA